MTPELFRAVSDNLADHEGRVLSMYLDSVGVVTCGVGHALFTPVMAYVIPFWKDSGTLATRDEIFVGWTSVKNGKLKRALMLSFDESDNILEADLARFEHVVNTRFPKSESYPLSVQVALYDIAFNCGSFIKWPHFSAHIDAREFGAAAHASDRPQVGAKRNLDTYNQITCQA